jgi:predicted DNA-binding transcriptional regulator YafY
MNRLDRISAILVQLQSRSVVRAVDCAERFGVSVRTVYRDIRTLEQAGVPVCGDAGIGYSLVEGYRLPPLMFTPAEALAMLTAEKFIEQMTDPHNSGHFRSAMDKVRAVMRGVDRRYMEGLDEKISVYRSRRTPEAKIPGVLQTLLKSIGDREILSMKYTGVDGSVTHREVEVVGVLFMHPFWYMSALCHLRSDYRTFRLDRIDSLCPTSRPHTVETHPPLKDLINFEDEHNKHQNNMKINSIEVKDLAPIETIALTHTGDFSGIAAAFGKIAAWAGANNYWSLAPRMLGVYHDNPDVTPTDQLRSTAALEAKPGMEPGNGMSRYTVSGGKYLVMTAEVVMSEYGEAWQKIDSEVDARGLEHDARDHYELYVSCVDSTQGDDAPWIVDFCVPVK